VLPFPEDGSRIDFRKIARFVKNLDDAQSQKMKITSVSRIRSDLVATK